MAKYIAYKLVVTQVRAVGEGTVVCVATIRDVAKKAGVSVATVSAVITGKKRVSEELSTRVKRAMNELDYHPNALARALYTNRTNSVAFLVPDIANHGFSRALHAVEQVFDERDVSVFVCNTGGDPALVARYQKRLIDMRVDGVILALTWELAWPEIVDGFKRHGVHVVGLSGGRPLDGIDCFLADEMLGGYDLGRYLVGLGHRACAFIGPSQSAVGDQRLSGLRRAFRESGGELPDALIVTTSVYTSEGGREAALRLVASGEPFTCIVAFNDLMAVGVVAALEEQGMDVPQHVSVATFGDTYASLTRPRLTTMVYDEKVAGTKAAERLFGRIKGDYESRPEQHLIRMRIAINTSTRVPRPFSASTS